MKYFYQVPLLVCAVLVISSTAQAQDKAAVCKSNVQQLQKVVDGMDAQSGSQKNKAQGTLLNAKAQGDAGKNDECISLASNALNMLGIPPTAKVGAK
jgi:opacity protein-like surface antigen